MASTTTTHQLQQTLDRALDSVQHHSDRLQQTVVGPSLAKGRDLGSRFPVGSTFIAVFAVLSVVPLLSFLAFVSFVAVATVFGAAVFVSSVLFGTVVLALCFLIPTLVFTLSVASFASAALVVGFLAVRLYAHLRSAPTLPSAVLQTQHDLFTLVSPELSLLSSLLPSLPSSASSSANTNTTGKEGDTLTLDGRTMDAYLDRTKAELDKANDGARETLRDIKREADGGGVGGGADGKVKGE